MKKLLFIVLLITVASCKKEEKAKAKTAEPIVEDVYANLYGNWVGDFMFFETDSLIKDEGEYFDTNKLKLVIKKIENDKVYGQSIVSGNSRPLIGAIITVNGKQSFVLKEPGDKKNDGRFEFTFANDTIKGKWFVANKKYPVWERVFTLTKKPFHYDSKRMLPEEGEYVDWFSRKVDSTEYENEDGTKDMSYSEVYRVASVVIRELNASTTLLKESDVKNLKKLELEYHFCTSWLYLQEEKLSPVL
jgi:hypothetical protein